MKYTQLTAITLMAAMNLATPAWAASDEIQVYTDEMNDPGQYGVEIHLNYVPKGSTEISHSGEIASNHRFQATPEFSYGITKSLEAGLYVPTAISSDGNFYATGLRPRLKYIHPKEEGSPFFWGLNTEFGYSSLKVEPKLLQIKLGHNKLNQSSTRENQATKS